MFFNKRDVEIQDLEHRILILEKRLEDYRKESKKITSLLNEMIEELRETKADKRVKKTK